MSNMIWVDCDGVLADFVTAFLNLVLYRTGRAHDHEDVTAFNFEDCIVSPPESKHLWAIIDSSPGLVQSLREVAGARDGLEALRRLGPVGCLTSPHIGPHWMNERVQWLTVRGFTKRDVVFASDKDHVPGRVLIDDSADNCNSWAQTHRQSQVVLFDQPWNRSTELHPSVVRARGWGQVIETVKAWGG